MKSIEDRIVHIEQRNKKVELDKAWETSWTRRIIITLLTYIVIVVFMKSAEIPNSFINAIVPSVGFILSTLTLRFIKQKWMYKR